MAAFKLSFFLDNEESQSNMILNLSSDDATPQGQSQYKEVEWGGSGCHMNMLQGKINFLKIHSSDEELFYALFLLALWLVNTTSWTCYWYSSCNCTSAASEGCTVPSEPVRTEFGGHGHEQQPHGTSESRAESAAGPASRCSVTCTTSGTSFCYLTVLLGKNFKTKAEVNLLKLLKIYVVLYVLRCLLTLNDTMTQTSLFYLFIFVSLLFPSPVCLFPFDFLPFSPSRYLQRSPQVGVDDGQ